MRALAATSVLLLPLISLAQPMHIHSAHRRCLRGTPHSTSYDAHLPHASGSSNMTVLQEEIEFVGFFELLPPQQLLDEVAHGQSFDD